METRHPTSEQGFTSIEVQLARLGMNPQAPIVQSLQPHRVQYQAVRLLEQGATAAGPSPLAVPPPLRHVYNVTPAPPPQHQRCYQLKMVADIALQHAKFHGDMKIVEGWMLQMNDYFTIIQTQNE